MHFAGQGWRLGGRKLEFGSGRKVTSWRFPAGRGRLEVAGLELDCREGEGGGS